MTDTPASHDAHALLTVIDLQLTELISHRDAGYAAITALDAEQTALGRHPNYTAYAHGGIYADKAFGAGHILALAGFYTLDWSEALDRLEQAAIDADDGPDCLLTRIRHACETDAMLEITGLGWCAERGLLVKGRVNSFWIRRPKLGLGQAAKAYNLMPEQAPAHRGLYALSLTTLRRGFAKAQDGAGDNSFGAMLAPVIGSGGAKLEAIGAAALHADAETRYRADCKAFAEHQAVNPDRSWQRKPPRSRQGHLAVTTARAKAIALPAERTRGGAAHWLDAHDANIRFPVGDIA